MMKSKLIDKFLIKKKLLNRTNNTEKAKLNFIKFYALRNEDPGSEIIMEKIYKMSWVILNIFS